MATTAAQDDWVGTTGQAGRYTRVAMWLHWAIAFFIIWNLVSGFLVWDFAEQFFKAHRPLYFLGLISHMSAGMTVLALTLVRIAWRLMHEPPPYSPQMKAWERHSSHFVHFMLYAGMVLMPLLGWSILSAHPPAGSPGAQSWHSPVAVAPKATTPGTPAGPPPAPKIWGIVPLPAIAPIANIGFEPGGVKPQHILHEDFVAWHEVGAYLMLLLLCLHIAGALKHQIIDDEPELQRMGVRARKSKVA